jgi:ADP-ribose pyrophosphatase YjhB (NUDIX family)
LKEESERNVATGDQTGSMAVCVDEQGRILLVRPRDEEAWSFPGGNVMPNESIGRSAVREAVEELGIQESDIELVGDLSTIIKEGHDDHVTGMRPRLILHHTLARLNGRIHIVKADHEIADSLWLTPEQIIAQKVTTRENVSRIAQEILDKQAKWSVQLRDSKAELVQWWA